VLGHCRQQDHTLGPQAALSTVLTQRELARALEPDCPADLRPRMLSVLSEASRQAGWLSFDLKQFDHAGYYEDARSLAHEAENTGLGAFVLCEMSHLATWQGKPRIGIDEAARLLGNAGEIAAGNSSARLTGRLEKTRAGMEPWRDTAAVRELDELLEALGYRFIPQEAPLGPTA
jgi:hypothetical protein